MLYNKHENRPYDFTESWNPIIQIVDINILLLFSGMYYNNNNNNNNNNSTISRTLFAKK